MTADDAPAWTPAELLARALGTDRPDAAATEEIAEPEPPGQPG